MAPAAAAGASTAAQALPRDCVFSLLKAAGAVELRASLIPDGVSDKKLSKFVEVTLHPVKPWAATIEPRGSVIVWNFETSELVAEFSLDLSQNLDDEVDEGATTESAANAVGGADAVSSPSSAAASKSFLQLGSSSPTAVSYMKGSRRAAGLRMLFYDQEAIAATTQLPARRVCFDEWLIVLSASGIAIFDINSATMLRRIPIEDLQKQIPTSAELLPYGVLAVGCQDGKIRVVNLRVGKVTATVDSGSSRDVQQLLLLSTPPLIVCRNASGSRSTSVPTPETPSGIYVQRQFLVSVTLDGRVTTWRVNGAGADGADFIKISEMEIRDAFKGFDTSAGVAELRYHPNQETLTVSGRDGGVFIFDVSPLTSQNKPPNFVGVFPPNKLQSAIVLPGIRKGLLTTVSISASSMAVAVAEIGPKGRYVGKDNIPTSYLEFFATSVFESRDQRCVVPSALQKKFKFLSIAPSPRAHGEICCLTTFGLFVFNIHLTGFSSPSFIVRDGGKTPLIAYPGALKVALRIYGEDTSVKQEDHKLQCSADTAQEKLIPPLIQACPANSSLMSAIAPTSSHFEIIQMDSELRNQKSISMHGIFAGNAIAVAWHPLKQRIAALVPQDQNSRRFTRASSSNVAAPKRRGFMFGGSTRGIQGDDASSSDDLKQRYASARATTLAVYDIGSDGHVELVEESCATPEDQVLHIFSGPFLGVVRYLVDETRDNGVSSTTSESKADPHDTNRSKRTESMSLGSMLSPTAGGGGSMFGSTTPTSASTAADHGGDPTRDLKKTYLEFYEWDSIPKGKVYDTGKAGLESTLTKIGGSSINCPLFLEWERVTNRFCALAYPDYIHIYRISAAPKHEVTCVHRIPVGSPARSMYWFHQMLFFTTEEEVKCCLLSKARYFLMDIASRLIPLDSRWRALQIDNGTFPEPQIFPEGATTILGIVGRNLVLSGEMQLLHTISLSNRVLQCCMLIAVGQSELALQVAATVAAEMSEWLAAVFEAFGFTSQCLAMQNVSIEFKANVCIKHALWDDLPGLLSNIGFDSIDATGASTFQRACTVLHRAKRYERVEGLFTSAIETKHANDALFIASLLKNDQLLEKALRLKNDLPALFHLTKKLSTSDNTELTAWNSSLSQPTAAWKATLHTYSIRPPEALILSSSGTSNPRKLF